MFSNFRLRPDQGVDGVPRVSLVLANADSHCSQIERTTGWKGARLTAGLVFYDLRNGRGVNGTIRCLFQGICNPPDEILEATFRITATNRMNLQRLLLPQVRIQRRCPWEFPGATSRSASRRWMAARAEVLAVLPLRLLGGCSWRHGGLNGDGAAFTGCGYTRADCRRRGGCSRTSGESSLCLRRFL